MKISAIVLAAAGLLVLPVGGVCAEQVNDAQIASTVVTANQVDIDAGQLAASRTTNDEIKTFARLMVTDHTGVNKQVLDLGAKLKVTPQDNPATRSLKAEGEKSLTHLKTLNGAAFDKAYIDREVAYHQHVIMGVVGLTASDRSKPTTHTVTIENMRFQPQNLTVVRGDTVVWVNKDLVPHTATSKAGGFDSQVVPAGKSWRLTVRTKGEFAYLCTFHPTMTATLRVR